MKKILSGLAAITLGLSTVQAAFAAPTVGTTAVTTTSTKVVSTSKQARMDVESDILGMQQDGVQVVRSVMDKYLQDAKETGNMKFDLNVSSEDTQTKVSVDLEKYVSLLSFLKGDQEFGAKGSVSVDMSGSTYDYTATGTMDADGYPVYPKVPSTLSAKVSFDGNVKMVDGYVYFLLSEFKTERAGTDKEVKEFDEGVAEIQKYVGKTYRVSMKDADINDANDALKKFDSILSVLETRSLFEVTSTTGNVSNLQLKKSTLQALNVVMGRPKNAGLKDLNLNRNTKITYEKTANGAIILAKDRSGKNVSKLSRENGEYAYELKTNDKNVRMKSQESVDLKITKDSFVLNTVDSSRYSKSTVSVSWQNNQLDVKAQSQSDYGTAQTFTLSGPLDLESGNMDLKASVNSKEVGGMKVQTMGDGSIDYHANFSMDYGFMNMVFNLSGNERVERVPVEIAAPTTYENIN